MEFPPAWLSGQYPKGMFWAENRDRPRHASGTRLVASRVSRSNQLHMRQDGLVGRVTRRRGTFNCVLRLHSDLLFQTITVFYCVLIPPSSTLYDSPGTGLRSYHWHADETGRSGRDMRIYSTVRSFGQDLHRYSAVGKCSLEITSGRQVVSDHPQVRYSTTTVAQ